MQPTRPEIAGRADCCPNHITSPCRAETTTRAGVKHRSPNVPKSYDSPIKKTGSTSTTCGEIMNRPQRLQHDRRCAYLSQLASTHIKRFSHGKKKPSGESRNGTQSANIDLY
jgi:hypothetical protein